MNPDKQKLMALGAEKLADVFLERACYDSATYDLVERLVATPEENVEWFRAELAKLKASDRYYDWEETSDFAHKIEVMLWNFELVDIDPVAGVELAAALYRADTYFFEHSDETSDALRYVFRCAVQDLFARNASRCTDKDMIVDLIVELLKNDKYGVRGVVVDSAPNYLPEPIIRSMIRRFRIIADRENESARHNFTAHADSLEKKLY